MRVTGRCYCGEIAYEINGDPLVKAQCHCRECQYISGGSPNVALGVPADAFHYTRGTPKSFMRVDIAEPCTREFCGNCGTHLLTRTPRMPDGVVVKVGTLDDPKQFGMPDIAIWTSERQAFHALPSGISAFDRTPS
jgi:hypothetical protein